MNNFLKLSGHYIETDKLPEKCPNCECKQFYKQKDFKRSVGLGVVFSASACTCILFFQERDWLIVWSPMLIALIIDRFFASRSSDAALCYDCGLVVRSLDKTEIDKIQAFDLDVYDRIQYPKRTGEQLEE